MVTKVIWVSHDQNGDQKRVKEHVSPAAEVKSSGIHFIALFVSLGLH